MFKLHAVQAEFGDALILEHGTAAKPRYVLIDGGPPKVYEDHLAAALKDIVTTDKLDLVVLSHIDNDHVVGLLDFFAALEEDQANGRALHIDPAGLWHNSFQKTIDRDGQVSQRMQTLISIAGTVKAAMPLAVDAFLGVKEGHRLRILAKKLKVPVNKGFPNDLIIVDTAPGPVTFGKLKLTIVGPSQENLDELRDDWLEWLEKAEKKATNPKSLANSDESVPNLSSIVLLAECEGKTLLLTGDARSDHIASGLDQAGLLTGGKLHVDVIKVPHHGSDRNVTKTFFKNITADRYVISANGKHSNPDYPTLQWIVEAAHDAGRPIEIIITNATASTKKIQTTHKPTKYGYKLTVKAKSKDSIEVVLT